MFDPTVNDSAPNEHTFGRTHFSPPPLALEQRETPPLQLNGKSEWDDLDQRVRNVGEW